MERRTAKRDYQGYLLIWGSFFLSTAVKLLSSFLCCLSLWAKCQLIIWKSTWQTTWHTFRDSECRRPLWSENIQTDTAVTINIWVVNSRCKCNLRGHKRKKSQNRCIGYKTQPATHLVWLLEKQVWRASFQQCLWLQPANHERPIVFRPPPRLQPAALTKPQISH